MSQVLPIPINPVFPTDMDFDIDNATINDKLELKDNSSLWLYNQNNTLYTKIKASPSLTENYTIVLPSDNPTNGQVMAFNSGTQELSWTNVDTPAVIPFPTARTIYVAKTGNDTTGSGTSDLPYLTVFKALTVALTNVSLSNPATVYVDTGVYIEDNTSTFNITSSGISLEGRTSRGVIIKPSNPNASLFTLNNTNINIENIRFEAPFGTSTSSFISLSGAFSVNISNCVINFFSTAVVTVGNGSITTGLLIQQCVFTGNAMAVSVSGVQCVITNSTITGSVTTLPGTNNGLIVSSSNTILYLSNCLIAKCNVGVNCTSNSFNYLTADNFINNKTHILVESQSELTGECLNFTKMNSGDVCCKVKDTGSYLQLIAIFIDGRDYNGVKYGTGCICELGGHLDIISGSIYYCILGIRLGKTDNTDTSTTLSEITNTIFDSSNDTSISQYGTTLLNLLLCITENSKITINDSTNVSVNYADINTKIQIIGKLQNIETNILGISNSSSGNLPNLTYYPNLYNNISYGLNTTTAVNSSTCNISNQNSCLSLLTRGLNYTSDIYMYSDTSGTLGDGNNVRGWKLSKKTTDANLLFNYKNNILSGQPSINEFTLMNLDGVNKYLTLDTTAKLFIGDVAIYRSAADILACDGDIIIDGLTASRALTSNASKQITSSVTTNTELSYLSGVTSAIQTQLNNKLSLSGGVLTNTLTLPAGSSTVPQLTFSGGTAGLSSSAANTIDFITNGVRRAILSSDGRLTLNDGVTLSSFVTAGVLHNNASGVLSSSLIVDNDITNSTISNAKLAAISSTSINNNIVVRNGSGNFETNMITILGTPSNNTDVATKLYVDTSASTGLVVKTPGAVVSVSNNAITGFITIDGVLLVDGNRVLLTAQTNPIQNGIWEARAGAWTRPSDFNTGDVAGQAYILILQGNTYAGTSWLCSTPLAVIGTNNITFSQFSVAVTISGSNLGGGTGQIYKNTVSNVINFRTLVDGNFISYVTNTDTITPTINAVSTNTISSIVSRDASGNFSAGTITASLTGAASLNLLKAGGVMTGTLTIPAGSAGSPSLLFTGGTNTGLSMTTVDILNFDIGGVSKLNIASSGVIIPYFNTVGIVHNDVNGLLSSSLIVNADISNSAAIVDTKLATISTIGKVSNSATTATSANTINSIVARDASGNFSAGTITASLSGAASLNLLKAGDTMSGNLILPSGSALSPSLLFPNAGLFSVSDGLSISTNSIERFTVASDGSISIPAFVSAGLVHNSVTGLLTTSLLVNADISNSAGITDTKLATISSAGKVSNTATTATSANTANAIVTRDANGDFSARIITSVSNIISQTTNQLVLGTTNTLTINSVAPSTSRVYTINPINGNCDFSLISTSGASSIHVGFETANSGTNTITAAMMAGGIAVVLGNGNIALDTVANIAANTALAPFNSVGLVFKVLVVSNSNSNRSLTVGSGLTLTGPANITANSTRLLYFRNTGVNTWTIY